jgi:hypothetical protein
MPSLGKLIFVGPVFVTSAGVNPVPTIVMVEPVVTLVGNTLVTVCENRGVVKNNESNKIYIALKSNRVTDCVFVPFITSKINMPSKT